MIRGAMKMADWGVGMVFGCGGEDVECLCTGIEAFLTFGHDR